MDDDDDDDNRSDARTGERVQPTRLFRASLGDADAAIQKLLDQDLALTSMIPLGSCTMKLNATSEMIPVSWSGLQTCILRARRSDCRMRRALRDALRVPLRDHRLAAMSHQPNSGATGEYAGLLANIGVSRDKGEAHRNVCLIPESAHGTNPASVWPA